MDAVLVYHDPWGGSHIVGEGASACNKRIVPRFNLFPVEIVGDGAVSGIRLSNGELIETGLVLRSIGFRGSGIDGPPFDPDTATIPTVDGRVSPGVYSAGWIKRGPTGGIGTNRTCAAETVASLLADYEAGLLAGPATAVNRALWLWPVRSRGA